MKQYIKPTIDVVELSVKENIADLPKALKTETITNVNGSQSVTLTTYNLATMMTSIKDEA